MVGADLRRTVKTIGEAWQLPGCISQDVLGGKKESEKEP